LSWIDAGTSRAVNHLRLALRLLAKSPGFTALVMLTLALGIGANAAIFSVVRHTLLRALPYPQADRLVQVTERSSAIRAMSVSYPNFIDWRAAQDIFSSLAIFYTDGAKLKTTHAAEQVAIAHVSQDFFAVLGLRTALGRDLRPEDDKPGAAPVAWLSHAAWQRFFAGRADLVGDTVLLDGEATTIVGILPAEFRFHRAADVYAPIEPMVDRRFMRQRENHSGTEVLGRLKPGVTLEAAQAQMTAIAQRLERDHPKANAGITAVVHSLQEHLQGNASRTLYLLLGAVGVLLLIACVNVATMLLARSLGRAREMAIRAALGATRRDLVKQLLIESFVLALGSGLLGVLLGRWSYDFVSRLAPSAMQEFLRGADSFDPVVWLFVAGVTILTGVMFGLVPAWQMSRTNPHDALKSAPPALRTFVGRFHVADGLVLVQVGLAVVLLVGAGLLIRSLHRIATVHTGLRPEHVLSLRISTPPQAAMTHDPSAFIRHHEALLAKVQSLGDIQSAAFVSSLPYTRMVSLNTFYRLDRPLPEPGKFPTASLHVVTPDYFATMGIPLLRGASFDGREPRPPLPAGEPFAIAELPKIYDGFPTSAIISRKMADQFWPGEDPVGKTFQLGTPELKLPLFHIVGVVGNTTQFGAEQGEQVEYYTLLSQWPAALTLHLVVRTQQEPAEVMPSLRAAIREVAPDEPIFDVEVMEARIASYTSGRRFSMGIFIFFAATALLLAAIGIYGVMACIVGQRTRDIGIRMALGAQRVDVLRHVLTRGLAPALLGAGLGLGGAWAGSRLLQSQLFGITGNDVPTYVASALILLLTAFGACALPAWRAARTDPLKVLRAD
ncbi:MAG TPA: ABC transporter permease, partial [Candidatus Synoicihabitans sp.]|nr:ABC transporter permease [Candidatus Synoicihabitans sp.]